MKGSSALLFTLAMTAGLIALVVGLRGQYARAVAEHWRKQFSTVSDQQAPALLGQVAELGEPAIGVLVDALGSERESVARAAVEVLTERLNRWQMLHGEDRLRKQAALAESLAARAGEFGPAARRNAADLATQMLRWLSDTKTVDRSRVVASCEKVLRAAAAIGRPPAKTGLDRRPASPLIEGTGQVRHQPPGAEDSIQAAVLLAELSRLPGGGLRPGLPSSQIEVRQAADVPTEQPRRLPRPRPAQGADVPLQPGLLSLDSEEVRAMPQSTTSRSFQPPEPDDTLPPTTSEGLTAAETVDLMRRLRADQSAAGEAEAELMRRGFKAAHLELARRLFDPDPEIRKQLVRLLPGLTSVDAVPWMLWLSRDTDPEVRLAAITLMATTGDPALLEQVEQTARADPSPRIQQQAERIAGRRRGKRY